MEGVRGEAGGGVMRDRLLVQLERLDAEGLDSYGRPCATTLAKAHMQFGYMVASLMDQSFVAD